MIDLDFLEIGPCDYDSLVHQSQETDVGILVEPVKEFLDNLPSKPNVLKINVAISPTDIEGPTEIYYISNRAIREKSLDAYLKGCASLNKYHQIHRHLNLKHLVIRQSVHQVPIGKFLASYDVQKIKHLKIDTEGCDCFILQNLLRYLEDKAEEFYPTKITFETNFLSSRKNILVTIGMFCQRGYYLDNQEYLKTLFKLKGKNFSNRWPENTVLLRKTK